MFNIYDFDRILKTEFNLQHFTRNCKTNNLDDSERDEADTYLWRAGLLNMKENGMTICHIMNRCLVMFLRGRKVNIVEWNIFAKLKVNKWSLSKITLVPNKWSWIYCSEYFNVLEYLVWTSHEIKKVGGILAKAATKKEKLSPLKHFTW